jgi:hypothetical protein
VPVAHPGALQVGSLAGWTASPRSQSAAVAGDYDDEGGRDGDDEEGVAGIRAAHAARRRAFTPTLRAMPLRTHAVPTVVLAAGMAYIVVLSGGWVPPLDLHTHIVRPWWLLWGWCIGGGWESPRVMHALLHASVCYPPLNPS